MRTETVDIDRETGKGVGRIPQIPTSWFTENKASQISKSAK